MGAAPSRETVEHSLPQPPFYGQRQQIVLIPLLKKFFPSADCPLFVQLYEARCDPAVRYYFYADDGVEGISRTPPTSPLTSMVHSAAEGCSDDESPVYLADRVGNAPFHCLPMEVFPDIPFSCEAMYDAYVTNGGEKLVYDTDAEMLQAYRADLTSVRPMPCAVAFLYHTSMSKTSAAVRRAGGGEGGAAGASELAAGAKTTARAGLSNIPDDCSEVLGCYVKATGFVGDVQCLGRQHRRGEAGQLTYEMQMFLTKSAGDHNRTHVLLSAIYTYAEQWQRACLHCIPHDLTAQHAPPEAYREASAQSRGELDDASFFYKPFTQTHEMLVEASRVGGHYPHPSHGAEGEHAATDTTPGCEEAASDAPTDTDARGHTADHPQIKARCWAPPPLSALVLRSRRANVPLLCFLRETRACIANMFLFHVKYYYHEHQQEREERESTEEMVATATVGGNINVSPTRHPDMLPSGCWHMWLQDTPISSVESEATNFESVLNVHCTARLAQSIVEYIVVCLLHCLNPLEAFRSQSNPEAAVNSNSNRRATNNSPSHTDATADKVSSPAEEVEAPTAPITTAVKGEVGDDDAQTTVEAVATTTAAVIPHSLSLFRLPDEGILVITWPPRPIDETAAPPSTSVAADVLTQWESLYSRHYLFWVIGPSVESRRSATVAVLHWVQVKEGPVIWGYHLDEHDREVSSTPPGMHRNCVVYPSSSLEDYLCTVKVNGVEEEMLRGDTVLCLMPVTGDEATEERVLRVCRLPLEELLLGELRNASKLAREAGPEDPHWVRQAPSAQGTHQGCVVHAPGLTEGGSGATVVTGYGVELPPVPPEADGIVGDGTSCLWRVNLLEQVHRVIAVTPQFLKPLRKKHSKKKKLPSKAVVAQGTATQVFLAAPSMNVGAAGDAGGQSTDAVKETGQHHPGQRTEPVNATTAPTPAYEGGQTAVSTKEKKVEADRESPQTAASTGATATPVPTIISKNQKKKAKKAAAAAVALENSTETAAEATSNATATHNAKETLSSMNGKAAFLVSIVHPELQADAVAGAPEAKETRKAVAQFNGSSNTEPTTAASATEAARAVTKRPLAVIPPRPIPAGEIDLNDIPNGITSNKNRSKSQRTSVVSTMTSSVGTPTASHSESGGRGYGAGHAHPTAHPPGYGTYERRLPSYDAHAYPPPPPLPPPPPPPAPGAAAAVAGGCRMCKYNTNDARTQAGSAVAAPLPPPPLCEHSSGGRAPPEYESYYYPPDGYRAGYVHDDGCAGNHYDPAYGPMQDDGVKAVADSGARQQYQFKERVVNVARQIHAELVTSASPEEADSKALPFTERKRSDAHPDQEPPSPQEASPSSFQRHVSFGVKVPPTAAFSPAAAANAASASSRVARWPGNSVPLPLPLSEAVLSSQLPNTHHSQSGDTSKVNGAVLHSPQHLPSVEDLNSTFFTADDSRLHLQLGDYSSSVMSNGNAPAGPIGHHMRYASSPYQQQVSTFEDVGVASNSGTGPAGSSVNVHVRVRHHHHMHSPATSFFSDSTADQGSNHHHHTHGSHAQGEANASGLHPSQSFASMGSLSIVFQGTGGAPGSNPAGSVRERANSGVGGDHSTHSHLHRPHVPGAASSTRSGETTSTARLMDKHSGTYRWDWRTVGLDIGEEDS